VKFDLSKFKKIKEDRDSALLLHPEGHKIQIAKSALDRRMLDQLKRLPVHEQTDLATLGQPMAEGGEATATNQRANAKENTGKGKKKPLREFRDVLDEEERPSADEMESVDPPMRSGVVQLAEGGDPARDPAVALDVPPAPAGQMAPSVGAMFSGDSAGGVGLPPAAGSAGATPAPEVPAANPFTNVVPPVPAAGVGVNPGGGAIKAAYDQYIGGISKAIKGGEQGIAQEAAVQGHLGAMEAQAEGDHQGLMLKIKDEHENQYNRLNGEISNALQDLKNGDIDPNHYLNSKSTPGKIATAIGLVLGGMGSGLTGQPNQALQFLNAQIDRDVVAQRANLGKKGTVLDGFLKMMGNLNDATKMTWAFYNDLYMSEMRKQAALSQDPMAKATAQRLISDREMQKAQLLGPIAMQRALYSTLQSPDTNPAAAVRMYGQLGLITPPQAEAAMKEVGFAQNHRVQSQAMVDAFDAANQENTIGNRVAHAGYEPASVAQFKTAMMPYLKDAEGRINESELERTDELLPRPGDAPAKIAAKRQGLLNFLKEKSATPHLDSLGIRIPEATQTVTRPNTKTLSGYGRR